ncbi:MAG: DUF4920 domain-containing protein [Acidobacteria bacterium]|nr:DUF4920 domain-containing protein [Acidobacteriota bacterium]
MRLLFALVLAAGAIVAAAETHLGRPLTIKQPMPIAKLLAEPDQYTGKFVQVRGTVKEVCQQMGCWMMLTDGDKAVRIKVRDGDIVFPKDSAGKKAVAEGKFLKLELTREQAVTRAEHEAEESGRKFDPKSVTSGITIYQIQGTGAIVY